MLPAYLGLFVAGRPAARASAMRVGLTVSAGFVVVFTVVGVLVAVGGDEPHGHRGHDRRCRGTWPPRPSCAPARRQTRPHWGLVMVISGAFIFWYWATVLRADATALNANPLVQVIEGVTGAAARVVAARPALVAALLTATVGVSAAITLRRRATRATADDLEPDASTPAAGAG